MYEFPSISGKRTEEEVLSYLKDRGLSVLRIEPLRECRHIFTLSLIHIYYTREAGVRGLERKIGDICRKAAREILERREEGKEETQISVTASNLEKYLGKKKFTQEKADRHPKTGIVRGLAWTSVGLSLIHIYVPE